MASKRLSTEEGRSAAQALHRPRNALQVLCPEVLKLEQIAQELSRAFRYDDVFGSATPCKRAARFGVSPTIACS